MYDHIGLRIWDLDASVRFYGAALAPLGIDLCSRDQAGAGFGRSGQPALWLQVGQAAMPGVHLALRAGDRRAVDLFHAEGLRAGGRDNGGPGVRSEYSLNYYAAFLIDPDGNNIEVVCTE